MGFLPGRRLFSRLTALIQQPNGVFAVISADGTEFIENRDLDLFYVPADNGIEWP